ncbi:MAG: DUF362 domain-containing protein, partial [Desulfobacterales bacterium]
MNLDPQSSQLNRRDFMIRSAKAGTAIAAACVAGFWFHDTTGPGPPKEQDSDLQLPDFSIKNLPAKMSIVRGQDRIATLKQAIASLG